MDEMDALNARVQLLEDQLGQQQNLLGQYNNLLQQARGAIDVQQNQLQINAAAVGAAAAGGGGAPHPRTFVKPPKFGNTKGEEWFAFRQLFEQIAVLNRYDDASARLTLATCMSGTAVFATTEINPRANNLDLAGMLNLYEGKFMSAPASELARMEFEGAHQRAKESEIVWHSRLRTLHTRAYPNVQDPMQMLRKFHMGLRNQEMKTHVYRARPATYDEALEAAQNERACQILSKATKGGANVFLGGKDIEDLMDIDSIAAFLDPNKAECFECHQVGHIKKFCPELKKKREAKTPPSNSAAGGKPPARRNWRNNSFKKQFQKTDRMGRTNLLASLAEALLKDDEAVDDDKEEEDEEKDGDEKEDEDEDPDFQ